MDPYPSFFQNATGCTNYFNYMMCQVLQHTDRAQSCLCDVFQQSYYLKASLYNQLNLLHCAQQEPEDQEYFSQFVTLPSVRRAIHVGNLTFHSGWEVEKHLVQDVMKSIKPWLGVLMDNYRVRAVGLSTLVVFCLWDAVYWYNCAVIWKWWRITEGQLNILDKSDKKTSSTSFCQCQSHYCYSDIK